MKTSQCRYIEGDQYCAYHDDFLRGDEDIRCHEGGWDCFEAPGPGVLYEDHKWLTFQEYADWVIKDRVKRLPEGLEYTIPDIAQVVYSERQCPACQSQILKYIEGQPRITCECGAVFELQE